MLQRRERSQETAQGKQHPAGDETAARTLMRADYTMFTLIKKSHKYKRVPQAG